MEGNSAGFVPKIVVVLIEDDPRYGLQLENDLTSRGFDVRRHRFAYQCVEFAASEGADVILLDVFLDQSQQPSGLEQCGRLRSHLPTVPIITISVSNDDGIVERAFQAGAVSHYFKDQDVGRLVTNIQSVVGAPGPRPPVTSPRVRTGALEIDLDHPRVLLGGQEIHVTSKQYAILKLLAINIGITVSNDTILSKCWGEEYVDQATHNSLRDFVSKIRKLIDADFKKLIGADTGLLDSYIETRVGMGYRLRVIPPSV